MKKILFYPLSAIFSLALGFSVLAVAPTPPTGITATSTTPTSVNLTWGTSTDAVSYQIFRNSTTTPLATTSGLYFFDTGLTPSTIYNYYIASVDASNTVSALSSGVTVKTLDDISSPTAPAGLSATPASTTQINLSWGASTDNVGVIAYKIYVNGYGKATSSVNSYQDTGLAASTTYNYQISALDASGNESERSATTSATTLSQTPAPTSTVSANIIMKTGEKTNKLINIRSNQRVKIVVLGSADLRVRDIKKSTVTFGGANRFYYSYKDYNRDGKIDVIYSFRARQMKDLTNGTTTAEFKATLEDGKTISASIPVVVKNGKTKPRVQAVKEKIKNNIEKMKEKTEKKIEKIEQRVEKKTGKAGKNKVDQE